MGWCLSLEPSQTDLRMLYKTRSALLCDLDLVPDVPLPEQPA